MTDDQRKEAERLQKAVDTFMRYQMTGSRPAMTALQELVDAADAAAVLLRTLVAQQSADAEDARRYRWLRREGVLGFDGAPGWNCVLRIPCIDAAANTLDEVADAAIDAMKDKP